VIKEIRRLGYAFFQSLTTIYSKGKFFSQEEKILNWKAGKKVSFSKPSQVLRFLVHFFSFKENKISFREFNIKAKKKMV